MKMKLIYEILDMDIKSLNLVAAVKAKMNYHDENFKVQVSNLARSNVPGEKAMELAPFEFEKMVMKGTNAKIHKTNGMHLSGKKTESTFKPRYQKDKNTVSSKSGNNIDPQKASGQMTTDATEHKKMMLIYKGSINLIKKVLGK